MADALPDDREIRFEIQFEDPKRIANVFHWVGDCDERQDYVALPDVVVDPLLMMRDVAFQKVETVMAQAFLEFMIGDVHAEDLPVSFAQYGLAE